MSPGLPPEMTCDERETMLAPGESLLIYSDSPVEAHDGQGEKFGLPRLHQMACGPGGAELIASLHSNLADFTGPGRSKRWGDQQRGGGLGRAQSSGLRTASPPRCRTWV